MRSTLASVSLVAALALAPACTIYFPGDDDDDDCNWGGGDSDGGGAPIAPTGYRNPTTGMCEYLGGGGGGGCDTACGPCDEPAAEGDRAALPSWGLCDSYCTGLDEQSCLATAGCRGGYLETCPDNLPCDMSTQRVFLECWAVDQTGPIQGSCENLDAWTCSQHDDCVAVHYDACNSYSGGGTEADPGIGLPGCLGNFLSCQAETSEQTGCYGDADCAPGERCNAAEVCLPPPDCQMGDSNGDGLIDCEAVCYGWCVPGDPPPPPPPACEELATEDACVARDDCTPFYEGVNCTCDAAGCTCQDWVFVGCSSTPTDPDQPPPTDPQPQ